MRGASLVLLAVLTVLWNRAGALQAAEEAALLLAIPSSHWPNWDSALARPECARQGGQAAWSASTSPCGTPGDAASAWRGIVCNAAGRRLSGCGLQGSLPGSLAQLGSLEVLDLSHNNLNDGVPAEWTLVGGMPALTILNLAHNNLTGWLADFTPAATGFIAGLSFNVSHNALNQGTIPAGWYSRTLQLLDISWNNVSSRLPVEWGLPKVPHELDYPSALPSLARLAIEGNNISGPADPWPGGGSHVFSPAFLCTGKPGNPYLELVPPPPPLDSSSGGLSAGAIAGIVVGSVAAAALLAAAAFLLLRRRQTAALDAAGKAGHASSEEGGAEESGSDAEKGGPGVQGSPKDGASPGRVDSGRLPSGSIPQSAFASAARKPSGELGSDTDTKQLPADWNEVDFSELEVSKQLGKGSFGTVFLARWCHTTVAVKVLGADRAPGASDSVHRSSIVRQLGKEVAVMSKLRHTNVCLYMGACQAPPCLLMEHCSRQSLDRLLARGLKDPQMARQLRWDRLLSLALGAARGMAYLHSRSPPIYHRDLKAANILVTGAWQAKVADFNLSRLQHGDGAEAQSTLCMQNPRWLAPEVLGGQAGGLPADVWAFGTVLHELMTWRTPFEGLNPYQIIGTVQEAASGSGLKIPPAGQLPAGALASYDEYVALMQACWERGPGRRPTFAQVVERLQTILQTEMRSGSGVYPSPQNSQSLAASVMAPSAFASPSLDPPLAQTPTPPREAPLRGSQPGEAASSTGPFAAAGSPGSASCEGGSSSSGDASPGAAADDLQSSPSSFEEMTRAASQAYYAAILSARASGGEELQPMGEAAALA